jgi:glycosyltransferase involved in cell wall biosynthesis
MKILHVPYCYFPDSVGGTEVYVRALAREQKARGIEVEIAAAASSEATYEHSGVVVRRFATAGKLSLTELYGQGDSIAAESFERLALAGNPDIIHLHSYTPAVSTRLIRKLKVAGAKLIFTFHTPTVSCVRGDLLFFGQTVCSGEMRGYECSACNLQSHGAGPNVSKALAGLPVVASHTAANTVGLLNEKLRTALEMRRIVDLRCSSVREFLVQVDHIVAVCEWIREVLYRNGISDSKVTLSRQGLPHVSNSPISRRLPDNPLRLVFMGRLHRTKGIEMLADAVMKAKADVILDVYGTVQSEDGRAIHARLSELAAKSPRVRLCSPIAPEQVVETLANYHMLAVPSQWLETGPLVVYEAFAAALPVIGSNLGGIAELVRHGKNGMLLVHDRPEDWVRVIDLLGNSPAMVNRLAANVEAPRTMAHVADDMNGVYSRLVDRAESTVQA